MLVSGLVYLVAALHVLFMILETFLWTTPKVRARFGNSAAEAEATRILAANQGVYNGALAAALIWGQLAHQPSVVKSVLAIIIAVGLYGGYSAKRSIIVIQAMPAAAALLAAITW
ncbi:MAG: DUF1304 domain-containing protein [Polyangiaceae bacterium]